MATQSSVSPNVSSRSIQLMFDRLSPKYDLFNAMASLGMDRRWRHVCLRDVKPGMRVLDVGTGTGDLALAALDQVGQGEVIGLDFSSDMLRFAEKKRLKHQKKGKIQWVNAKAEDIPFEKKSYDLVVSGFVLRNLYENINSIIGGVYRSLRPGGRISFVDLTEPPNKLVRTLSFIYVNVIAGIWGRLLLGKAYPREYLVQSMTRFIKAVEFKRLLCTCGFESIESRSYLWGLVTLYRAKKPS
jgi:demethylmenaquinone methyltransferase / 2-methoxy-6-polyprenyl-1,4-benzoquinol methylase